MRRSVSSSFLRATTAALCRPPLGGLICGRWVLTCWWHLHSVVCMVRPDKYYGTVLLVQGAILRTKTAATAKSRTQRPSHSPTCRGFCFALNGVEMERDAPCSTLDSQACVYQRLSRHTTIQSACIPRAYSLMSCCDAHASEKLHDVCLSFLVCSNRTSNVYLFDLIFKQEPSPKYGEQPEQGPSPLPRKYHQR